MLKNYFTSAARFFMRNRLLSFINVAGLAIGISAAILILLFVVSEKSYDKHHKDSARIYRINSHMELAGQLDHLARNSPRTGPEMQAMFPEVESYMRLFDIGKQSVWYEDKMFSEKKVAFVDSTFFDFFDYTLLAGSGKDALDQPYSVVISDEIAEKYFGSVKEAEGKTIRFTTNSYKVTGVYQRTQKESHIDYDFLLSMNSLNRAFYNNVMGDYFRMMTFTYLKLKPGVPASQLENKFPTFYAKNIAPWIKENNVQGKLEFELQPLTDIHLNTSFAYDYAGNSNISYLYIFAVTGLFILLIACINYMNLSTAHSLKRAKEVGIRMVSGASRGQLMMQFLGEALLISLAGFVLALAIVELLLPLFNQLTGKNFSQASVFRPQQLGFMFVLVLFTGLVSGSYPAFFLTSVKPGAILKPRVMKGSGLARLFNPVILRKYLVILQFTIAICLMIGTLVVSDQLRYMKNKDLGFNKEGVLVIQVPNDSTTYNNLPTLKNEFLKRSDVAGIASASQVPGGGFGQLYFIVDQDAAKVNKFLGFMWIDEDFFGLMNIPVSGRNFSKENPADVQSFIINEACAKFLGWKDPIGKEMENGYGIKGKVIGVVKDFNYASLHNPIEPMVFMYTPQNAANLMIRMKSADLSHSTEEILERWKSFVPNHPLESFFLDDHINQNYVKETNMLKIFGYFTTLTIIISCLGLFGLAAFTTEQRTKEIGIRKVIGASVSSVTTMVTRDFIYLVLISGVLALPLAWYFLQKWLQGFAYHITFSALPFVLASALAVFIACSTVAWLAYRAASANPVKSLRYE